MHGHSPCAWPSYRERSSIPHQSEIPRCLQKQPRLCRLCGKRSRIQKRRIAAWVMFGKTAFTSRAKCDSLWKWIKTSLRMCHCTNSTETLFNTKYLQVIVNWTFSEHLFFFFFSYCRLSICQDQTCSGLGQWKQMLCFLITMQPLNCIKIGALSNSSPIIN